MILACGVAKKKKKKSWIWEFIGSAGFVYVIAALYGWSASGDVESTHTKNLLSFVKTIIH